MTAVANDYGFEKTYSRLLEAKGNKGDVLIAISTSGNSQNIVNAVNKAKEIGMSTISFTGQNDSKIKALSQICLNLPQITLKNSRDSYIVWSYNLSIGRREIFPKCLIPYFLIVMELLMKN